MIPGLEGQGGWGWPALSGVVLLMLFGTPCAAQWAEEPGRGWISGSVHHHDTRTAFDMHGARYDFVLDGRAVSTSGYLTAAAGLVTGIDAWAQLSFHRFRFDDSAARRVSTGPGDARLYLRANPLHWIGEPLPFALRAGVKLPVGDLDVGSSLLPLGDGQTDYELLVEAGRSFHPKPLYLMGWVGHRWRAANRETGRSFGDEWFYFVQVGGTLGVMEYKLILEGLRGDGAGTSGGPAYGPRRELAVVNPSLGVSLGPGAVELGLRVPVAGKNLPAGHAWTAGYFMRWGS